MNPFMKCTIQSKRSQLVLQLYCNVHTFTTDGNKPWVFPRLNNNCQVAPQNPLNRLPAATSVTASSSAPARPRTAPPPQCSRRWHSAAASSPHAPPCRPRPSCAPGATRSEWGRPPSWQGRATGRACLSSSCSSSRKRSPRRWKPVTCSQKRSWPWLSSFFLLLLVVVRVGVGLAAV